MTLTYHTIYHLVNKNNKTLTSLNVLKMSILLPKINPRAWDCGVYVNLSIVDEETLAIIDLL